MHDNRAYVSDHEKGTHSRVVCYGMVWYVWYGVVVWYGMVS